MRVCVCAAYTLALFINLFYTKIHQYIQYYKFTGAPGEKMSARMAGEIFRFCN